MTGPKTGGRSKFIQFALTPSLFNQVRQEAKLQNISVSELIRRALWRYLSEEYQLRRILGARADESKSLLNTPLVNWTPEEERFANEVIQRHFDEDR